MASIATGTTIICGKNQSNINILPIQFGQAIVPGSLEGFSVVKKENLRAYEVEFGIAKAIDDSVSPPSVYWFGCNGTGDPKEYQQAQPDLNTFTMTSNPNSPRSVIVAQLHFQDDSRELDLVSIEESSPGVFVDPRLSITVTP